MSQATSEGVVAGFAGLSTLALLLSIGRKRRTKKPYDGTLDESFDTASQFSLSDSLEQLKREFEYEVEAVKLSYQKERDELMEQVNHFALRLSELELELATERRKQLGKEPAEIVPRLRLQIKQLETEILNYSQASVESDHLLNQIQLLESEKARLHLTAKEERLQKVQTEDKLGDKLDYLKNHFQETIEASASQHNQEMQSLAQKNSDLQKALNQLQSSYDVLVDCFSNQQHEDIVSSEEKNDKLFVNNFTQMDHEDSILVQSRLEPVPLINNNEETVRLEACMVGAIIAMLFLW